MPQDQDGVGNVNFASAVDITILELAFGKNRHRQSNTDKTDYQQNAEVF